MVQLSGRIRGARRSGRPAGVTLDETEVACAGTAIHPSEGGSDEGTARASLALGLTAALVATSGAALGQAADDEPLTFHVGTTEDINSVNPFKAFNTSDYEVLLQNYNMLYGFSAEDLSPVPELTTGCEPSTDHMTWTCEYPGRRHLAGW